MAKILLVEDEIELAEAVKEWLTEDFHLVETVNDGESALTALERSQYDLLVLDWLLPGVAGIDICRKYRADGGQAPVLMLTAKKSLAAKESALLDGADDYLTKPFQLRELSARVKALSRRAQSQIVELLECGQLKLQRSTHRIFKSNKELRLAPKEFSLLELFMRFPEKVFSADELLERVWGTDTNVVAETVRSTIKSLRRKIDDHDSDRSYIATVHGIGYKLELH